MVRRLLVCLGFATWCFLTTWVELAEGGSAYFARYDPLHAVVLPVVCWEILITAVMLALWELVRRRRMQDMAAPHLIFLLSCFVPLGIASVAALRLLPFDAVGWVRRPLFWPLVLLLGLGPLTYAIRRPRGASRLLRGLFLYSWPVLAVILIQATRATLRFPASAYADGPLAAPLRTSPKPIRVIWIIFDELSQEIAFANRPASLRLPNFDRLKAESFYASAAESPSEATETALPALILGTPVLGAKPAGPNALLLTIESGSRRIDWNGAPNVFDAARQMGYSTALTGWFHPYGRVLNRSLTQCYWNAGWLLSGIEEPSRPRGILAAMWDRGRLLLASLPLAGRLPGVHPGRYHREAKIERFRSLLEEAQRMAADPSIGLALIHLPAPHPPAIYSRSQHRFTTTGRAGYLDSVALADDALGVLRHAIDASGLAQRTALLVSSDHGWRTHLWRGSPEWTPEEEAASRQNTMGVPFLLKLPGQAVGVCYDKRFDTVLSSRMITAILEGRLTDPARIADAIER